ncbi:hypothetical protein TIFTF001_024631 [Ficus carica]|uniref:Surfeit locus protein 5 n=1 Tax=Ficus carica TaxID=3494 RepID=A0AA88DGZ2_FICCA|nr:hypothetical protein TIFTF001_024631 [Ficus carica]
MAQPKPKFPIFLKTLNSPFLFFRCGLTHNCHPPSPPPALFTSQRQTRTHSPTLFLSDSRSDGRVPSHSDVDFFRSDSDAESFVWPSLRRGSSGERGGEILKGGGGGASGGAGGGGGPTAAAAAAAAQKQKALMQRVEGDIASIVDNFSHLVSVSRVSLSDNSVRNSQESFMMEMRAARMVQSADSLLKLVSELKQTAIFAGFASLNDHVDQRTSDFDQLEENSDRLLARIADEASAQLKELESCYYSSQPSQI